MTLSAAVGFLHLARTGRTSLSGVHSPLFPRSFIVAGKKTMDLGIRGLSQSCQCTKDQTPKESLQVLQSTKDPMTMGTGLFLVPAPEKGILESRVVIVPKLTYIEAAKRGTNCEAFKWLAEAHLAIEQIEADRARCPEIWCGNSHSLCPSGCFCSYLFCR